MTIIQASPVENRCYPSPAVPDCRDTAATDGDRALGEAETIELLMELIPSAVLAPSSHNTQPWRFRIRWDALELHLDRSHALPVADPVCRELVISCGAALENIRIALHHRGFAGKIDLFPYSSNPDVLARIQPGKRRNPRMLDELLFASIPKRHTNRAPFFPVPLTARLVAALEQAAEVEGAWLRRVTDEDLRPAVADLVRAGDRQQWSDHAFRGELVDWLRPDRGDASDGIPVGALALPAALRLFPALARWLPIGRNVSVRDATLALDAPYLGVLGTVGDTPRDWLAAGQALQMILLIATANGISASFLNQPVQVPRLRARLRSLLGGTGFPQMVIRMGVTWEAVATPRRPLHDVVA